MSPNFQSTRRRFIGQLSITAAALTMARKLSAAESSAPPKNSASHLWLGRLCHSSIGAGAAGDKILSAGRSRDGLTEKVRSGRTIRVPEKTSTVMPPWHGRGQSGNRYRLCCHAKRDTRRECDRRGAGRQTRHLGKAVTTSVAEAEAAIAACRSAAREVVPRLPAALRSYHQELMRLARDPDFGLHRKPGEFSFTMETKLALRIKNSLRRPIMDLGVYLIRRVHGCGAEWRRLRDRERGPKTRPDMFTDVEKR